MPLRGGRCKERLKESAEWQAIVEMVMVVVVGNNNSFVIISRQSRRRWHPRGDRGTEKDLKQFNPLSDDI